jgi:quinol monooxygenase YgiN
MSDEAIPVVETIAPGEYFNALKDKKQKINDKTLADIYDNCLALLAKYDRTNQHDAMRKLMFHIDTIEKERMALAAGIDTFVYLADVKKYVEKVQDRVVKIIEIERYEREIPDDVIEAYEKVKTVFNKFFVVFTDYTKEHVDKSKKERDPILFGMFQDKATESNSERLYFIGDWEDEYCDLTLDRLVSEMKGMQKKERPVEFQLHDTKTLDDLRSKLKALDEEKSKGRMSNNIFYNNSNVVVHNSAPISSSPTMPEPEAVIEKPSFFKKVRSFLRV